MIWQTLDTPTELFFFSHTHGIQRYVADCLKNMEISISCHPPLTLALYIFLIFTDEHGRIPLKVSKSKQAISPLRPVCFHLYCGICSCIQYASFLRQRTVQESPETMDIALYSGISFFCSKLCLKKLSTSASRIDFKLCMITLLA